MTDGFHIHGRKPRMMARFQTGRRVDGTDSEGFDVSSQSASNRVACCNSATKRHGRWTRHVEIKQMDFVSRDFLYHDTGEEHRKCLIAEVHARKGKWEPELLAVAVFRGEVVLGKVLRV